MAVAPILIFLASCGLVSLTAAFTDRGSPLRYISLAILLWLSWIFPPLLASFSDNRGWTGRLLGGSVFWNAVTLFDRLILRGWDFGSYSQQTKEASKKTGKPLRDVKTRMEFGSAAAGDARGIGTFWEVKNVPRLEETAPFDVSERMTFVCWHVVIAVGCYYVHNKAISSMLGTDAVMLQDERIPFLSRVSQISMDELYARSVVSLSFWASQRAMLEFFYSLTAALSVLSKPEDIKPFPPLFG